MKYKLITNVSHVDLRGARMWCHALLIDMEGHKGFGSDIRQIRGLSYGGMPVFTVWIDPKSTIEIRDTEGNTILMSNDGKNYNLGGVIVSATNAEGDRILLGVAIDNFRGKIVIEDLEQEGCPFGEEIDERILPHASGQAYPSVVWMPIPDRIRRSTG